MWKYQNLMAEADAGGSAVATPPAPAPAPVAAPPAPAPSPAAAPAPAAAPSPATAPAAAPAPGEAGYWPSNWRETVSKADEKVLARLQRYQSPEAAMQALIAAQNKISSGELKPVLAKDASPEELADYRKSLGIPVKPEEYVLKDVKIDEGDKPFVAELLKSAHSTNQTPEQIGSNLKVWNDLKVKAFAHQAENDARIQGESEETLRAEWGPEFKRNINLVHSLLDGVGTASLKDSFLKGRLADGTPIGSSPEALRMLLAVSLKDNPMGVVVPGGNANLAGGIKDELEKINALMKSNRSAYDKDDKMQARFRDLTNAAIKGGLMDEKGNWK